MYRFSEITTVHLEITSKCNVSCPMCLRNVSGGAVNPHLPLVELSLEDIKRLFPLSFLKQLNRFYMCGNYGDPMVAQDTLKIFQFLREVQPSIHLSMFTNGSGRIASWWKELGLVVDQVHFGIDGLEDTLSIYRRQADFKKIMESAKSYISGGGKAVWDYIVFRHNEHQVEKARELAEKMGFDRFVVKKTGRFFSNEKSRVKNSQEVLNKKGEVEYLLEPPKNIPYQNRSLQKEKQLSQEYGSLHDYLNQTEIQCRVSREKSLYVSAEGLVFPCCWMANQLYPWYLKPRSGQVWQFVNKLPEKENSLNGKRHPIEQIVQGDFFQALVPDSWNKTDITRDKLRVCAKTCGKKFNSFDDQFR